MKRIFVALDIDRDDYLLWYQGTAKNVVTQSLDGRTVRFPAEILRPYVSYEGVKGTFAIDFNDNNKFQAIYRVK